MNSSLQAIKTVEGNDDNTDAVNGVKFTLKSMLMTTQQCARYSDNNNSEKIKLIWRKTC